MNGGGWVVFKASNHFLGVAPFLPTADGPRSWSGRSAPAHQRLKSQRSVVTAISTTIVHLMRRQMSDKAVVDGPVVHSGRSARTLKMHFTEPVTFKFFCFSTTGRSTPEAGRFALGLGWCLLLHRMVRSVNLCFCNIPVRGSPWCRGRSTARARTVRVQVFFQKASPVRNNLRYSGQST
jgi:hypothetical protein